MPDQKRSPQKIAAEARDWCARLNAMPISVADIEAVFRWLRDPANARAFQRADARARKAAEGPPFSEAEILRTFERRPDLAAAYHAAFERNGRPASQADIARELAIKSGSY